ncbi:MAG: MBL fold metallo-hydrolase [Anaerolineae bacterium]|nr:MBL fold metallo-hydrolase [Anaerolineae bacterium]
MDIQLIRNATLRVEYNGRLLLIDPCLGDKHSIRSFAGISPNPTVDLPMPAEAVIADAEMVIISHLHPDHFDEPAQALLPKNLPLFCQPDNETTIREAGFQHVTPVTDSVTWEGITFTRTPGQHGFGELAERMGAVSGFIWQAAGEPTVYWVGDSIWYEPIAQVIADVQPDVIITHSGGARFGDSRPIVMDEAMTLAVCQAAPQATIIAVHIEALDHCPVTRTDLRTQANDAGIPASRLLIPADGETITF